MFLCFILNVLLAISLSLIVIFTSNIFQCRNFHDELPDGFYMAKKCPYVNFTTGSSLLNIDTKIRSGDQNQTSWFVWQ